MKTEESRPWGRFITFAKNEPCTVKLLILNPNEELSLQTHEHRTEHWFFLDPAVVHLGNRFFNVSVGQSVIVNKGVAHRIHSLGNIVRVIEVSFGVFDENDEVRISDKYNRVKK